MTVELFYPNAHVETVSVDGWVERYLDESTWTSLVTGNGTAFSDVTDANLYCMFFASSTLNKWGGIYRTILVLGTSTLPNNAVITAATISLYGKDKADPRSNAPNSGIYAASPASDTALANGDYQTCGATLLSDLITYAGFNAAGWNVFTLTAVGRSYIALQGASKFSWRNQNFDVANQIPAYGASDYTHFQAESADTALGHPPVLTVTYTLETHFQDGYWANILGDELLTGEPTALNTDNQIDLWYNKNSQMYYSYSTDGHTFAAGQATDVTAAFGRSHILKVGAIYYLYSSKIDGSTMHLFTSTNKINFTDQGEVIPLGAGGAWDDTNLGNMFAWKDADGIWKMLYEASGTASPSWSIGLATASAPEGPWTKYGSNPVIAYTQLNFTGQGLGNPEMMRTGGNSIIKHNGLYYIVVHGSMAGDFYSGPLQQLHSADLHTWVLDGRFEGVRYSTVPFWDGSSGWSYGDHCLVQFGGHTCLFWSPSNQVDASHMDLAMDNRSESVLLGNPLPQSGSIVAKLLAAGVI